MEQYRIAWEEQLDRLDAYLKIKTKGTRHGFTSIDHGYEMWPNPEHLAQWLPPMGATMRFLRSEPQLGGTSFYEMAFAGGEPMYGRVKYLEFHKPSRIVYTQQFCDAHERVIRPVFLGNWPLLMRTTVELAAEGEQATRRHDGWVDGQF